MLKMRYKIEYDQQHSIYLRKVRNLAVVAVMGERVAMIFINVHLDNLKYAYKANMILWSAKVAEWGNLLELCWSMKKLQSHWKKSVYLHEVVESYATRGDMV